jgi:hypothetical protein
MPAIFTIVSDFSGILSLMRRPPGHISVLTLLLLVFVAVAGTAIGAEVSLADVLRAPLAASTSVDTLGPITEVGRKGWDCKPEHAAVASSASSAELPESVH